MDVRTPKPPLSGGQEVPGIAGLDHDSAEIVPNRVGFGPSEAGTFAGSAIWAYSCPCGWSIRSAVRAEFERRVTVHDDGHSVELVHLVDGVLGR